jgi:hypothetical protein
LPKRSEEVACLAFCPKACPFSGQSMPYSRMRSDFFSWSASMVSASRTLMTSPLKSAASPRPQALRYVGTALGEPVPRSARLGHYHFEMERCFNVTDSIARRLT